MKQPSPQNRLAVAALNLASKSGWLSLTQEKLAKTLKLPLAEIKRIAPSISDLLPLIVDYVSGEVVKVVGKPSPRTSVQDRLFEIIMARLDFLQAHRQAILTIGQAIRTDPVSSCKLLRAERIAIKQIAELAGLTYVQPQQLLLTSGLSMIYFTTLYRWRSDETADMAKTMALLDRLLHRANKLATIILRQ